MAKKITKKWDRRRRKINNKLVYVWVRKNPKTGNNKLEKMCLI